jgi:hypothetical protein
MSRPASVAAGPSDGSDVSCMLVEPPAKIYQTLLVNNRQNTSTPLDVAIRLSARAAALFRGGRGPIDTFVTPAIRR